MLRLIKYIFYIVLLTLIAITIFAYFGDLSLPTSQRIIPLSLPADAT